MQDTDRLIEAIADISTRVGDGSSVCVARNHDGSFLAEASVSGAKLKGSGATPSLAAAALLRTILASFDRFRRAVDANMDVFGQVQRSPVQRHKNEYFFGAKEEDSDERAGRFAAGLSSEGVTKHSVVAVRTATTNHGYANRVISAIQTTFFTSHEELVTDKTKVSFLENVRNDKDFYREKHKKAVLIIEDDTVDMAAVLPAVDVFVSITDDGVTVRNLRMPAA